MLYFLKKLIYKISTENSRSALNQNSSYVASKNLSTAKAIKNNVKLGLAITYDTNYSIEDYVNKSQEELINIAKNKTTQLARDLGLEIEFADGIGGWAFTDNADARKISGELSFPISIKNYHSMNDVKLFASLLADTSYKVQNSVAIFEYDNNGRDAEFNIPLLKINEEIENAILNANIDAFTLETKNKILRINFEENDKITLNKISNLIKILNNKGVLDGTKEPTKKRTRATFLGTRTRQDLYGKWLKEASLGRQNQRLSNLVLQAQQINQYILDNSDENGQRLPKTLNKSNEILDYLNNKKIQSKAINEVDLSEEKKKNK